MKPGLTDIAYMVDGDAMYKEMALVSLYSLARVCRHPVSVHMYYFDESALDPGYVTAADRIALVNSDIRIVMKPMPENYRHILRATSSKTPLGTMCCGRFLLSYLLPEAAQCMYIDSDTLFLKDPVNTVGKFWEEWSFESDTAGVLDAIGRVRNDSPLYKSPFYVNGGVLVMDLDLWRKRDLGKTCMFDTLVGSYRFCDQDVVNAKCRPVLMPHTMNFIASWPRFNIPVSGYNEDFGTSYRSYEEAVEAMTVLHFTGDNKPFNAGRPKDIPGVEAMMRKYDLVYKEYVGVTGRVAVASDGNNKDKKEDDK